MPDRLPPLIAAAKTLASTPKWAELDDQFNFTVPLDIGGVTQLGLRLRGKCSRDYVDQNLTFQIEYQFRGITKLVPVTRIDWRPIKPHQNPNFGPMELRLLRFHASHHHLFQENYDWMVGNGQPLADNIRAKNIPIAVPLDVDPLDLAGVLALMGRSFNIDGVGAIPAPPWKAPRFL
ncbi:MAG: hypothetical protein HQL39_08490 [Alphaproteobacteria bacterium]|nr:hypothetical protein [Alphaproteobacteria bacterium]